MFLILPGGSDRSKPIKQLPGNDPYGLEEQMNLLQLQNVAHEFEVEVGQVGVTVRKGRKWFQLHRDSLQRDMELWVCERPHHGKCDPSLGCRRAGVGKMIGAWVGALGNLPQGLLQLEHEHTCRDMPGLMKMLEQAYGEIDSNDVVTALMYLRVSSV